MGGARKPTIMCWPAFVQPQFAVVDIDLGWMGVARGGNALQDPGVRGKLQTVHDLLNSGLLHGLEAGSKGG